MEKGPSFLARLMSENAGIPEFNRSYRNLVQLPYFLLLSPGWKHKKMIIIIIVLAAVAMLSLAALLAVLLKRERSKQKSEEDPKAISKTLSAKSFSLQKHFINNENMQGQTKRTCS